MNNDLETVERVVYGFLDWLGDIGGFYEAMIFITFFFISLT